MRLYFSSLVEASRITNGDMASAHGDRHGAFVFPDGLHDGLHAIASSGADWQQAGLPEPAWEHVSVSFVDRCPTWYEMCWAKDLFWNDEEPVIQLHPPKSEWVNNHPHTLHLWKPVGIVLPRPPKLTV